jgi:dihydroorotate dehydrogenase (NAD+) catalytic subunit
MTAARASGEGARIGSVVLPNPVLTASGTSGHGAELGAYFDLSRLGAVVVKSLAAFCWPGNPAPRLRPVEGGMLNSVGLQGPGVSAWLERDLPGLLRAKARIVASIWGRTVSEFRQAATMLADAPDEVVAVEVNVSCPNLDDGEAMFAESDSATAAAVEAAHAARRPCWAKLSPGVADVVPIAKAAVAAGAEALVLVNTLPARIWKPELDGALGGGAGGLSGPALMPVALSCVAAVAERLPGSAIVGVGGIQSGLDAAEFLAAGAAAVEVGTATLADPRAPVRVLDELEALRREKGADMGETDGAA